MAVTVENNKVTYRALLIGNEKYTDLSRLYSAPNNVAAMKALLKQSATAYRITTVRDRTANGIERAIAKAFADADSNDISLFYYAGHGSIDGSLLGVNNSRLSTGKLAAALKAIPGKVIVILDSCYSGTVIAVEGEDGELQQDGVAPSGAGFGEAIVRALKSETVEDVWSNVANSAGELRTSKFVVLTSASWSEESWNVRGNICGQQFGPKWASLMTRFLTLGAGWDLQNDVKTTSEADANHDKKLTLQEAAAYTGKWVTYWMKYVNFDQFGKFSGYEQHVCYWPTTGNPVLLQLK